MITGVHAKLGRAPQDRLTCAPGMLASPSLLLPPPTEFVSKLTINAEVFLAAWNDSNICL